MHIHAHTHVCDGLRSPSWCRACVLTGKVAIRQISWICVGVGNRNSFRVSILLSILTFWLIFFFPHRPLITTFSPLSLLCARFLTHTRTLVPPFSRGVCAASKRAVCCNRSNTSCTGRKRLTLSSSSMRNCSSNR